MIENETTENTTENTTEMSNEKQELLETILLERKRLYDKLDVSKITDSFISLIQRAEVFAVLHKRDFFIVAAENGLVIMSDEDYEAHAEKATLSLNTFLDNNGIVGEARENEIEVFNQNLVIQFIDHKEISDDLKTKIIETYGKKENE